MHTEGQPTEPQLTVHDIQSLMAELRGMALQLLKNEGGNHSVSPTALVMTGLRRYKVADQDWADVTWQNRHHCFGSLHQMMRRALIDFARRRKALKRPPLDYVAPADLDFYDLPSNLENTPERVIALEEALQWLSARSPALAQVIEYHYFSRMKLDDLAAMMESSKASIKRKLEEARLLLNGKILHILNDDLR